MELKSKLLMQQLERYFKEDGANTFERWNMEAGNTTSAMPSTFQSIVDILKEKGINADNFDVRKSEIEDFLNLK